MSNYTKSTDFASKDTLPSGDSAKIVRGTEIDAEFEAIETAVATKANTSDVSSTYAPLNSPTFTGSPVLPTGTTAVTQTAGDNDTSVATTAFVTTAVNNVGYPAFKNRIINGAMMIDQRNAGASVTPTDGQYTLDRWKAGASAASKFSVQQSTTAPAGFNFSMLLTSLSAYSAGTNDNFEMFQLIEGFNSADFGWGTANAQTITIGFWVRSSLTGTHGGSVMNGAFNRSYPFTYTINSANTFEFKTVTVAGDTGGTWVGATNGAGLVLCVGLGAGSGRIGTVGAWAGATYYNATGAQSLVGTSGATLYITGVQLEKGSTATSFDYRPYGTELVLCQRYYQTFGGNVNNFGFQGYQTAGAQGSYYLPWIVQMRSAPTVTLPAMANTNTTGMVTNNPSASGVLLLTQATATGNVSSLNLTGGSGAASAEL